ncbi:MAG: hypothetical protein P8Q97_16600 [Myxococcota bacterium]|nr:hypothetical protein [Myxococcota bacterium]
MSLAESLEGAAEALSDLADQIRPANGDPFQLLDLLDRAAQEQVLGWLFTHEPDAGFELASAWLEDDAGAALVISMPEEEMSKAGRKALRRLVHRARSRGVAPDSTAVSEPRVGRLPDLDEGISLAYVSHFDPRGGRLVYLVESNPGGGARVVEALLDVSRGIVDFQVYRAGRRQVGDFVRDLKQRARFPVVETEPDCVRALIARRLAGQAAGSPLPKAFNEWRGKLALNQGEGVTPAERVRSELKAEGGDAKALCSEIEQGKLGPWPPDPSSLEQLAKSLQEEFSEAERDPSALEARLEQEVLSLYTEGEAAKANAERFDETAYLFWKESRDGLGRACLEAADGLTAGEPDPGGVLAALVGSVRSALKEDLEQRLGWVAGTSSAEILAEEENK